MMPVLKKYGLRFTTTLLNRYLANQKTKFNNKNLTLITNNCIGGIILNDLKLKFNTPTINLYFYAPDYIAFLERLDFYLDKKITFSYNSKYDSEIKSYPVGNIGDVEIHFLHYDNCQEAKEKWETRVKRVNPDNLFIIASDRDNCTTEIIDRFLKLPFTNKVFFSSKKISAKEVIYFKEYSNDIQVGDLIKDDYSWYFYFNTIRWLNTGEIKKNKLITAIFNLNRSLKKVDQSDFEITIRN